MFGEYSFKLTEKFRYKTNTGVILLALILAIGGSIVILLARSFADTKTINTAAKEVNRPYRVRIRRDQARNANCKTSIDKEFKSFVNDTEWQNRMDNINNLKKHYLESQPKCNFTKNDLRRLTMDISCDRQETQKIHFCDFNLKIPDALWRYKKLLHLFKRSLEKIKKMGMRKELETVNTDDWHQLFNKMQQLVHGYSKCNVPIGNKINITEQDFISPYDETATTDCEKREEAASVLNQLLLVLEIMKDDLGHPRKDATCA